MENETKNTIIDIIPLTRIPLSRQQNFSYLYQEKIPFGSLVAIPLFHREVQGIVINNRDDFFRFGNIKLRKINKILDEELITENQLRLAEFISNYYLCPLGIVLKFFVIKKTRSRIKNQELRIKKLKKIILANDQKNIVKNIISHDSKFIIHNSSLLIAGDEKLEIYLELISKTLKAKKQTLFLVPEISLVFQMFNIIKEYFSENTIASFHSQLKGSELYANYQKIKSGEAKIIIGTRQAVFAPFRNLGLIIVDEEQDSSYKQWDMNPRYNAKTAIEKLTELFKAKIVLSSVTPSVETYHKENFRKLQVAGYGLQVPEIIDLKKEGWNNNRKKEAVIISKKLASEISWNLKNKRRIILFVNRRGMSSFSVCDNCKSVLRCPRCERALIYDAKGIYRCLHCAYRTSIFPECPKCHGNSFKNIGIGNQTVQKEIKKMFPEAKTKLIDLESLKKKDDKQKLFDDINQNKFDIIIGTQTALRFQNLPDLGLIAIINADEMASFSDFNSDEKVFQILTQAAEKIKNIQAGKFIIQTYNPENLTIQAATKQDIEEFYKNELEQRIILKYPPYYRLVKLIFRTKNKNNLEKETKIVFEKIKTFSENNKNVLIFEPFIPFLSKIRDGFRKQIIIKIRAGESALKKENNIPEDLKNYLQKLGSDWIIDIDPISLT
ncbi:MAG: primosomal protein N' [bacterium]|nr:primosomal protein N' [bacterium]